MEDYDQIMYLTWLEYYQDFEQNLAKPSQKCNPNI